MTKWKVALSSMAAVVLMVAFMGMAVTACQTLNPVASAETTEQKAFAVYGTFVIAEEMGAKLVQDATVPANVKQAIRDADAKAKPAADALLASVQEVLTIKSDLDSGKTTADKLAIATEKLNQWITDATPKVTALLSAVKGGK